MSRCTDGQPKLPLFPLLASALAALLATGCREHFDRRDTLLRSSGDSVELNVAAQTLDPWPRAAWRTSDPRPGKRAVAVIEEYYKPSEKSPSAADSKYSTAQ